MSTFQILSQVSAYSAFIPLLCGIVLFFRLTTYLKWLFALVVVSVFFDLISANFIKQGRSALPAIHLFFIIQLPIVHLIYEASDTFSRKFKLLTRSVTIIALISLVAIMWDNWEYDRMIIAIPIISSIAITIICIIFIIDRINGITINDYLLSNSMKIFAILLLYHCSTISSFTLYESLIKDVYTVKLIVYVFFNLAVAYIFYKQRSLQEHGG